MDVDEYAPRGESMAHLWWTAGFAAAALLLFGDRVLFPKSNLR